MALSAQKLNNTIISPSPSPSPCPPPSWLSSLPLAPEFRPSLAEFADPIAYISKIEPQARSYGICKIIPPFSPIPKNDVLATLNRSLLRGADSPPSIGIASASQNVAGRKVIASSAAPLSSSSLGKTRSLTPPPSSSSSSSHSPSPSCRNGGEQLKATFFTRRQQLGCSNGKRGLKGTAHVSSPAKLASSAKASPSPSSSFSSSSVQKLVWQSGESYTLEQFEAKAKQFSRSRLKTVKEPSPLLIETLFWKEASSDRCSTVEYGNDIHASAFEEPTMASTTSQRRRKDNEESPQEPIIASSTSQRKRKRLDLYPLRTPSTEPKPELQKDQPSQEVTGEQQKDVFHQELAKQNLQEDDHFLQQEQLIPSEERLNTNQSETHPNDQSFCLKITKDGESPPSCSNISSDGSNRKKRGRHRITESSCLAHSSWNMHFIARAPGSLLRYMPNEVPGVTSPMVYLGMLFSWFAWHVEDHELHSINYLHTGAPKTWYAVPGDAAQAFEEVVQVYGYGNISDPLVALALLGEKTTVMSPEVLVSAGVPCCRLVQNAGDFVVTFPRAYHLGFSHGFNCGEAANFATPGWLEVAKEAASRRASMNHLPMLSHQQLLYSLALSFAPRIPMSLSFESTRSSELVIEETIKTVFVDDIAATNRLLGLLLDTGVTGCLLLRDGADSSWPPSKEILHDHCKPSTGVTVSSGAITSESLLQKSSMARIRRHQSAQSKKCSNVPAIHKPPFRWGTLPCAACGVLCFPTMAVVKPVSIIVESSNTKEELSDTNALETADVKQRAKEENLSVAKLVNGSSSHQLGNGDHKENLVDCSKGDASAYDAEHKEKFHTTTIANSTMLSIRQENGTAVHSTVVNGSVSVLDFLATKYQEDYDLNDDKGKLIPGEAECGSLCFHPRSSLVSDDHVGYTEAIPFHSLIDVQCPQMLDHNLEQASMTLKPLNELETFVSNEIPLSKGNTELERVEFMHRDISEVDCIDSTVIPEEKRRIFRNSNGSDGSNIIDENRQRECLSIENQNACIMNVNYDILSCTGAPSKANNGNTLPEVINSMDVHDENLRDVKETSTLSMQTLEQSNGWEGEGGGYREPKLQSNDIEANNKHEVKQAARSGLFDGKPQIFCDSWWSETDIRPHCLCLEHALEACHKLKSLGGSQIVLVCHSDIEEMQQCAESFAEELSVSRSWRHIPFCEASDNEEVLLNMTLNVEDAGINTCKDWVVRLRMGAHENGSKQSSHQSVIWHKDPCSSSAMDECNMNLTHTKNTHKRIRESYASGKLPKHQKLSVAGKWCGKVWMNSQVHPVLGGLHSADASFQAHSLSVGENASNCTHQLSETPKNVVETVGEMDVPVKSSIIEAETQDISLLERLGKRKKPNRSTRNNLESGLGLGSTPNWRKKREKEESDGSKDLSPSGFSVNPAIEATERTLWTNVINDNICPPIGITKIEPDKVQIAEGILIDHNESDADIWQDIDAGCDPREVMCVDGVSEVPVTSLMLHTREPIHTGVQENLLLPGIMRRTCSVFDSETHVHSPCQEGDCMPTRFVECTTGEPLHGLMGSEIPEVVGYATVLEGKQNRSPSKKKHSKDVYGISNSSVREYSANPLDKIQDASFFGHSRDFRNALMEADYTRRECSRSCPTHTPTNQKIFADSDTREPQQVPTLEFATENLRSINNDSSQWRSSNGAHKSQSLIQCRNKKSVGKTKSKLRKLWKSEVTGSSDDEMFRKKTTSKSAQVKCDLDDQFFDYAGFFPEGPSTRLRTRNAAKILKVDEDNILNIGGNYNNAILDGTRRVRKPHRRRDKKLTVEDAEEEIGAHSCDIEGCTMSFTSKQELNLHKRNACTFVGCGKRFGSHKYLLQHRRVHVDERPLKCPWKGCQMTFKWKWACTEHYRVHTGERPYVCSVPECGRTFRFVSDFSRHKRKTGHGKQQIN